MHKKFLSELGFIEIEPDTWTKNIFFISLKPPHFAEDRGKCIILMKPNYRKLKLGDRHAHIVYKGRYFFDDINFAETLFEKIGFYKFDSGEKNKTYEFNRETLPDNQHFIDEEFLKF